MGIGDAKRLQQALDAAVLAVAAMQGVEADIGPELGEARGDVAADIDAGDAVALPSSASAQAAPELSETSRSEDQPPISTATWICLLVM